MPATNREIVAVTPYTNPAGQPRCKVEVREASGTVQTVPLHSLSRPEITAAARKLWPALPGNAWTRLDNVTLQTLIREGDQGKAAAALDAKNTGSREGGTPPRLCRGERPDREVGR